MHGKGYGMPSSHAQFVSFFAVSLTLFLLLRHQPSTQHHHNSPPRSSTITGKTSTATNNFDPLIYPTYRQSSLLERLVLSLLAICGATAVAASRIYLSYHTPRQVLVGVIAGILFALLWFMGTSWLRTEGWVEWGLDTYLARLVRLRDLIVTEDLQDAGWGRWEARRRMMVKGKRT
ncbi:hypothetical protein LTR05_002519 [Lithohypha guttulata]|uniref:Phosphatidic acid phosphatase type 2/haloperoxidase domain-containing protein n=1 Tax=Lithohypha guttulata TaxID=1690604 RepID=A0AAN7T4R8_9EURO|nr:hypothetical protein LTR05_002519 [Lithohypha guttulata]